MKFTKEKIPAENGANQSCHYKKNYSQPQYKNQSLCFADINAQALLALQVLLNRWLPDGIRHGHEYKVLNPKRSDRHVGSFSINIRTGRWADFATGDKGGDVISLAAYLFGMSQLEALQHIAKMLGVRND